MLTTRTPTSLGLLGNQVDDVARAATAAKALRDNLMQGGAVIALTPAHLEETLEDLLAQIARESTEALKTLREGRVQRSGEANDAGAR